MTPKFYHFNYTCLGCYSPLVVSYIFDKENQLVNIVFVDSEFNSDTCCNCGYKYNDFEKSQLEKKIAKHGEHLDDLP